MCIQFALWEEYFMKKRALLMATAMFGASSSAQAADLTLCWAALDPANALVELSKDFEAQSGHSTDAQRTQFRW